MKRKLMFLALAALGLASCNGFKKGDAGMSYNIIEDKSGPSIKAGDFVSLNVIIKNDADSVLMNSYTMGRPQQLLEKIQQKGDIFSALTFLSEGDSAIIKLNIDSVTKGHPPVGFKGKNVIYVVKIVKVIAKGNLSDEVFAGRYNAYLKTLADGIKKAEPAKIKKYIADNSATKFTQTGSGLYYIITKPGAGDSPKLGDTAVINYVGKTLDGKVFDSSIKAEIQKAKLPVNPQNPYKPLRFEFGHAGIIKGLLEGIGLMNKGAKGTFVLPSNLAYGQNSSGPIQPFSPLVFDIELVDIVHANPNAPKPVAPKFVMPTQQKQPAAK